MSFIGDVRAVDTDVAGEVRAEPKGERGPGFFIGIEAPGAGEMGEHFRVLSTGWVSVGRLRAPVGRGAEVLFQPTGTSAAAAPPRTKISEARAASPATTAAPMKAVW